jgi:hypothetical protein
MKPTAKQLSYLRALAIRAGQTFTRPASRSEASREIQRLRAVTPSDRGEQRREQREFRDALTRGAGNSARVRDDEISGYGSSCRWR